MTFSRAYLFKSVLKVKFLKVIPFNIFCPLSFWAIIDAQLCEFFPKFRQSFNIEAVTKYVIFLHLLIKSNREQIHSSWILFSFEWVLKKPEIIKIGKIPRVSQLPSNNKFWSFSNGLNGFCFHLEKRKTHVVFSLLSTLKIRK